MAVLVEAISVIVRRRSLDEKFRGGWGRFVASVPNATLCYDKDIARVGFMSPEDVENFVGHLEAEGLIFQQNGQAMDIAVLDQTRGPTTPVNWLEFSHVTINDSGDKVAACWFFEGPRIAYGVHMPAEGLSLVTPPGWSYENSLSAQFQFVANEEIEKTLELVRHEEGTDVYRDRSTGKERYVHRSNPLTRWLRKRRPK